MLLLEPPVVPVTSLDPKVSLPLPPLVPVTLALPLPDPLAVDVVAVVAVADELAVLEALDVPPLPPSVSEPPLLSPQPSAATATHVNAPNQRALEVMTGILARAPTSDP